MTQIREPEWTAENMNREGGDTTFQQCGWCAWRGSGSYRYGAMLSGSCRLLRSYANEVKWDTECKVAPLGRSDVEALIRHHQYRIQEAERTIQHEQEIITALIKMPVADKPPLPENRPDYYNYGDAVWVYHDNRWRRGIVVRGYRSHEGCVSYVLDDVPESRAGWGCGVSLPSVLKDEERAYFLDNPDDFKRWLRECDRTYNGYRFDMDAMFSALIQGVPDGDLRDTKQLYAGREVA